MNQLIAQEKAFLFFEKEMFPYAKNQSVFEVLSEGVKELYESANPHVHIDSILDPFLNELDQWICIRAFYVRDLEIFRGGFLHERIERAIENDEIRDCIGYPRHFNYDYDIQNFHDDAFQGISSDICDIIHILRLHHYIDNDGCIEDPMFVPKENVW